MSLSRNFFPPRGHPGGNPARRSGARDGEARARRPGAQDCAAGGRARAPATWWNCGWWSTRRSSRLSNPAQRPTIRGNSARACSTPSCSRRGRNATRSWNFAAGSAPRQGRSSRASTSPRARPTCAASWRTRGCTCSSLAPRGGVQGLSIGRRQDPPRRVPDLQPGTGDAAQGRHAARAVARHPAPAPDQSGVQGRARRRAREGARRHGAVGRLHRARRSVSRRLHGVARRRRAQRLARHACCGAS